MPLRSTSRSRRARPAPPAAHTILRDSQPPHAFGLAGTREELRTSSRIRAAMTPMNVSRSHLDRSPLRGYIPRRTPSPAQSDAGNLIRTMFPVTRRLLRDHGGFSWWLGCHLEPVLPLGRDAPDDTTRLRSSRRRPRPLLEAPCPALSPGPHRARGLGEAPPSRCRPLLPTAEDFPRSFAAAGHIPQHVGDEAVLARHARWDPVTTALSPTGPSRIDTATCARRRRAAMAMRRSRAPFHRQPPNRDAPQAVMTPPPPGEAVSPRVTPTPCRAHTVASVERACHKRVEVRPSPRGPRRRTG